MADEEKEETEEKTEGQADVAAPKSGGSKKWLFIGGGVFALILLIGTPLLFLFVLSGGEESQTEKENPEAAKDKQELVLMMEGFEEDDEAEENEHPMGAFYPFETFVVNLSGGGYLRCQAQVEFAKRDIPKKFFSKIVPIRDALIDVLANKSRKDLGDEEGRSDLKAEIKDIINEILRKKEVEKVYFTQFIIQ